MNDYRKFLVFLGDVCVVLLSFVATLLISFPQNEFYQQLASHTSPFALLYIVWFIVLYISNLYDTQNIRIYLSNIQTVFVAFVLAGAFGMLMFYLFPIFSISPKTNLLINLGLFIFLFVLWRRMISGVFSKKFFEKVLIVGVREESKKIHDSLSRHNPFGYRSFGIVDSIDEAVARIRQEGISRVIIAKNIETLDLYKITRLGVDTLPLVRAYEEIYERIPLSLMNDDIAIQILNKEKNIFYKTISRILDICVSLFVLLVTLPFTILSGLLIVLQDGLPFFFNHQRVGLKNRIFTIFKFRSMIKDSEKEGAVWAEAKDPRVTPIGKILRKTHIDEIPQMINILKGDISLVGPRPERPEFVKELENEIPYYFMRHIIKPGFTGWAQIKFRYARTKEEQADKLEYDLFYLKNRSLALDFGILLKTIQIIFTH